MTGEDAGVVVDLDRQFTGRRQYQGAGLVWPARGFGRLLVEQVQDGEQEGGGLARAGLRLAGKVTAVEPDRQRRSLDRGAIFETGVSHAAHNGLGQGEAVETGLGQVFFAHGAQAYLNSRPQIVHIGAKGLN